MGGGYEIVWCDPWSLDTLGNVGKEMTGEWIPDVFRGCPEGRKRESYPLRKSSYSSLRNKRENENRFFRIGKGHKEVNAGRY